MYVLSNNQVSLLRASVVLIVLAMLSSSAHAQELRDFCAERPGKGTPPCILDKGRIQAEVGLADAVIERGHGARGVTYAISAAEFRMGLTTRLEAEVGWTPYIIDRQHGAGTVRGTGDALVGARFALTDPDKIGPALSIQGFVTAPTATHGLGAGGWTGGVRLPASLPIGSSALGLTPEVDIVRDSRGHGTHLAWSNTIGVSRDLGTASFGTELWGQVDDDPSRRVYKASADFTAALLIGKNAQLDAGVNIGLNHATADAEVYAGIAKRF